MSGQTSGQANGQAAFDKALAFVLRSEGGFVDDPRDPGGATNMGISSRAFPGLDVAKLDEDGAAAIYRREYWDKPGLSALPPAVAAAVFDAAVNCGPKRAVEQLQTALNRLGATPPLAVDSRLGPRTAQAAKDAARGQGVSSLIAELLFERLDHYEQLCADANRRAFLRGWLRRVLNLRALCSGMADASDG